MILRSTLSRSFGGVSASPTGGRVHRLSGGSPQTVHCRAYDLSSRAEPTMGLTRVHKRHWLDGSIGHVRSTTPRIVGGTLRRGAQIATWPLNVNIPDRVHACGSQYVAIPRVLAAAGRTLCGGWLQVPPGTLTRQTRWQYRHNVDNTDWRAATGQPWRPGAAVKGHGSKLPNFHWLRPSMRGRQCLGDLGRGRSG